MSDDSDQLTAKQQRGIEALLSTRTVEEAAKKAKVAPATLYRWLQTDVFKTAYRTGKAELVSHSITRIQGATTKAVDTLLEIVENKDARAQTRLSACKAVLDYSFKAVENEVFVARIEALEAAVEKEQNYQTPAA